MPTQPKPKPKKRKFSTVMTGASLTDTSFAPSCDVNRIVAHYDIGSESDPYLNRKMQERFGDATGPNYLEALRATAEVNSAFMSLSASERAQHSNDPSRWLDTLAEINAELDTPQDVSDDPPTPSPDPDPPAQEVPTE